MPGLSWHKLFDSLIENTEEMKTITDFPLLLVNLSKAKGLLGQDLRDVNQIAVPFDLAIVSYISNGGGGAVLYGRQSIGVGTRRAAISSGWGVSSQPLMRTLLVILLYEKIIFALLSFVRWLRWDIVFKRSMHAFVTTVLLRLSGLDLL